MNLCRVLFIAFSLLFWNFSVSAQNPEEPFGFQTLEYLEYEESQNDDVTWGQMWDAYQKISGQISCISVVWTGIKKRALNGAIEFINPVNLKRILQSTGESRQNATSPENDISAIDRVFAEIDRKCFNRKREAIEQREGSPSYPLEPATQFTVENIANDSIFDEKTMSGITEPAVLINWLFERKRINSELERQGTSLRILEEKAEIFVSVTPTIDKESVIAFMLIQRGINPSVFREANPEQTLYLLELWKSQQNTY